MHRYLTLVGDSLRPHIPEGVTQILQPHFSIYIDTGELCRAVSDVSIDDMSRPRRGLAKVCYSYLIPADRPGMTIRDHLQNFFSTRPRTPGTRAYLYRVHELRGPSGKTGQLEIECTWFTPEPKQQAKEHHMEINELGYYRTREGKKVRVICVDAADENKGYPPGIVLMVGQPGMMPRAYSREGKRSTGHVADNDSDIVAKWVDKPIVQWKYMPAWAEYVAQDDAQDDDGPWFWYAEEPEKDAYGWSTGDARLMTGGLPKAYEPTFSGHWKESLVKRPNDEPSI